MTSLYAEDIPAGSHKVYVWKDGEYGQPYDLACIFQPFRDGGLVCGAIGHLTRPIILALIEYAKRCNYPCMYFSRAYGGKFTRFAQYAFSEDGLDYYRIDLDADN